MWALLEGDDLCTPKAKPGRNSVGRLTEQFLGNFRYVPARPRHVAAHPRWTLSSLLPNIVLGRDGRLSVHLLLACSAPTKRDLSSTAIFAQEKGISVEMAEGGSAGA